MAQVVHRGRWTLEDRADGFYRELPVEVPDGAGALTVRLAFDRSAGVLDLGCFGPDGFRGWSGGARDSFTITPGWATPGYLPGPLEGGIWHVCLGLHRVPAGGLEYEVVAEAGIGAPPAPPNAPPPPTVPARPPRRETCPPSPACAGSPATCTATPCTPTAR
ncbi:hypothetical protein [Pseudonocardia alaniniphila]|uniref:hypothetical protein n=1 Tax=Pseudonocardia alaniniphila TaxID=75291 RepID=UPI00362A8EBC